MNAFVLLAALSVNTPPTTSTPLLTLSTQPARLNPLLPLTVKPNEPVNLFVNSEQDGYILVLLRNAKTKNGERTFPLQSRALPIEANSPLKIPIEPSKFAFGNNTLSVIYSEKPFLALSYRILPIQTSLNVEVAEGKVVIKDLLRPAPQH